MPLISVLITSYNREKFISQAIESVLNSTYQNFELIIVDDKSSDGTFDIIQQYKSDMRIRIFRNDKNLGQFINRNKAASYATGKYLKYLDSDDMLYPHSLEVMVNSIEQFSEAGCAISHTSLHENEPYPILMTPNEAYRAYFLIGGFPNTGPSAAIIRKDVFDELGGFRAVQYVGNDTEFWLRVAAKYPIIKMQPSLIWYRKHQGQEYIIGINSFGYLIDKLKIFEPLLKSEFCPLTSGEKILAIEKFKYRYSRDILHVAFKQYKLLTAYHLFKHSGLTMSDIIKSIFIEP